MSTINQITIDRAAMQNTPWLGWNRQKAEAAFIEAFCSEAAQTIKALKSAMKDAGVSACEWQAVRLVQ